MQNVGIELVIYLIIQDVLIFIFWFMIVVIHPKYHLYDTRLYDNARDVFKMQYSCTVLTIAQNIIIIIDVAQHGLVQDLVPSSRASIDYNMVMMFTGFAAAMISWMVARYITAFSRKLPQIALSVGSSGEPKNAI
ncbi:MAG: hypothetical protein JSS82_03620 [Bacteroidetes bacterium]|nr:hypothetical protein [Bacteroidota bacterium]